MLNPQKRLLIEDNVPNKRYKKWDMEQTAQLSTYFVNLINDELFLYDTKIVANLLEAGAFPNKKLFTGIPIFQAIIQNLFNKASDPDKIFAMATVFLHYNVNLYATNDQTGDTFFHLLACGDAEKMLAFCQNIADEQFVKASTIRNKDSRLPWQQHLHNMHLSQKDFNCAGLALLNRVMPLHHNQTNNLKYDENIKKIKWSDESNYLPEQRLLACAFKNDFQAVINYERQFNPDYKKIVDSLLNADVIGNEGFLLHQKLMKNRLGQKMFSLAQSGSFFNETIAIKTSNDSTPEMSYN